MLHKNAWMAAMTVMGLGLGGCAKAPAPDTSLSWGELIDSMASPERIARIDAPATRFLSSADPTGGNDDFNHFRGVAEDGWNILADLEGPGYLTRFWFTGAKEDHHRIRFFFDDESEPRIDTDITRFCGGEAPFVPPLAANEQACWWNTAPIPFRQRLRILSEPAATDNAKHYHQINYTRLPEGQDVQSYPDTLTPADHQRLAALATAWEEPEDEVTWRTPIEVPAGETVDTQLAGEAGVMKCLRIRLQYPGAVTALARERALREIRLQLRWDDQSAASVDVPLGDFFGSVWVETHFQSAYFGADEQGFVSRFPMAFSSAANIAFVNESAHPVTVDVGTSIDARPWTGELGYFHATWRRSGPKAGRAHTVLKRKGSGRFAGCVLAVTSLDDSWWVLESDETMRIDGRIDPQWKGTGLEDYFTGGWYYTNVRARPFHGLVYKAPYRTAQYRTHADDAITFRRSFDMTFERGPDQESNAWMASTAFYYLDAPTSAGSELGEDRQMPRGTFDPITIMAVLTNLERLGGIEAASKRLAAYLDRFPRSPNAQVLRLRQLAYREAQEGFSAVEPLYRAFLEEASDPAALQQAEDLIWFHQDPSHALLALYCANQTTAYFNGRRVATVQDAEKVRVVRVEVEPGAQALALEAEVKSYPQWVLAHLRTHYGNVVTRPDWRFSFDPVGLWKQPGFDAAGWAAPGGDGVKGPPETPHRTIAPNAYVRTVSEAVGIRPRGPTARSQGTFVFRREFVLEESTQR